MNVVAIIPCYNVEQYCEQVIEETLQQVAFLILVDDGSTDRTGAILQQILQKKRDRMHLIVFPKNRGKGEAILEGMKYAMQNTSFDVLITLDSDGQHLPSEIPKLVSHVAQGANLVIGCRQFDQMPFRSRFANTIISFLLHCIFVNAPNDTQSGFRAFTPKFVQQIVAKVTGSRYEMEFRCLLLALHENYKTECCPIQTIYLDKNRSSHFLKMKDSIRILKVFFNYWKSKSL